jgi:hypothetical protein
MLVKVIFDDNTTDLIFSHMLQFGIEFSLNGKKIKMFYSDAEEAWVNVDGTLIEKNFNPNEPLQRSRT